MDTKAGRMTWDGLTPPYATIVADPPWPYEERLKAGRREGFPYSTMDSHEIAALPVADLAAPGAHLYLWTTNHYLPDTFDIVKMWGFAYASTLVWCKAPKGKGVGSRYAITTEFIIHAQALGSRPPRAVKRAGALIKAAREAAGLTRAEVFHRVRGRKLTGLVERWEADISLPRPDDWRRLQDLLPALAGIPRPDVPLPPPREPREVARVETTWWQWPRGAHSEKPPAFLDVIEQVSPGPYVELFARQPRLGWDSWGWGYEQKGGAA
jgi:N6-adenosine-specific RNA methylase IME4